MLKLYGAPMSSASRCRWLLEEAGVPYELVVVNLRDPAQREAYERDVFPGGKIPYLVDGDVRLFESMAINFYVAERYAPALLPADPIAHALALQWTFWAITNLQPEGLAILRHTMMLPPEQRDPAQAEAGRAGAKRFLDQLEASLPGDHLLGDAFSVADVNVGSVVNVSLRFGVPAGPKVTAWMERLRARPAFKKTYAA